MATYYTAQPSAMPVIVTAVLRQASTITVAAPPTVGQIWPRRGA